MPLADLTAVANLALDHLGEPYLTDYETDTGTTAAAVRLHLPQCIETVLEGHAWSFATRTGELDKLRPGNGFSIIGELTDGTDAIYFPLLISAGTVSPVTGNTFTYWTSDGETTTPSTGDYYQLSIAHTTVVIVSHLATITKYTDGSAVAQWSKTIAADLTDPLLVNWTDSAVDPSTGIPMVIASMAIPPGWSTAWFLPTDCLRLRQINSIDIDQPELRFEIQGRQLLLSDLYTDTDPPAVTYITNDPPVDEWPTTFTDAVAFLLASRLAPKLTQSQTIADSMFQKHEIALGKARSKDTRETRSAENNTPRMLAAKSGLVQSRYGRTSRPPY